MLQSTLFTKTRKDAPKDEVAKNAQLLIRGGFVYKEMAGAYAYLPLGLRVFEKIVSIIREEMNAIGGQEISMTALQNPEVWGKTNRWSDEVVDNWFKTKLESGTELGLGFTHEEPITKMVKDHVQSFRDLPFSVYQFQTKFRNEKRAKSGIMRGREFVMKDLYSFSRTQEEHDRFYEKAKEAYLRVFERVGLGNRTYTTFASGGTFSKYSHEFQTLTDAGEDTIYIHEGKRIAVNEEVLTPEVLSDLGIKKEELKEMKAVEVGNIFSLGTKFSEPFELVYLDQDGKKQPVIMGSYGIGPGRLMGTIVETLSDEKGIVWPAAVAPFRVHLLALQPDNSSVKNEADTLYALLQAQGIDVLYDDRILSPGAKFADADLIGIPHRVVISQKTIESGKVEYKQRADSTSQMLSREEVLTQVKISR
jgi:prolyl-tRNA synthetase